MARFIRCAAAGLDGLAGERRDEPAEQLACGGDLPVRGLADACIDRGLHRFAVGHVELSSLSGESQRDAPPIDAFFGAFEEPARLELTQGGRRRARVDVQERRELT